jgi:hypothetical protein
MVITTESTLTGVHDFDFLRGDWQVHNRKLVKRLQNCTEWETFDAQHYGMPLLGGIGNTDELTGDAGSLGMSIRLFNLLTQQWSIYWVSPQDGILQPPMIGSFKNGIGTFDGVDEFDGKPILVRFTWSNITATTARWQQAFSPDNGQTWEVNWIMEFSR